MANPWFNSPYPVRDGMPNSGVVQSDGEWQSDWDAKLASVPQSIATGATPVWTNIQSIFNSGDIDKGIALMQQAAIDNPDYKWLGRGGTNAVGNFDPGDYTIKTGEITQYGTNPEWARIKGDYDAAAKLRGENQVRQQQAYNTSMMGNGAIGGVMTANYSDPNYGQVTGKVGGLGSLGGMDLTGTESPSTGAYLGGSGAYNPSPFSANTFTRQGWGGF